MTLREMIDAHPEKFYAQTWFNEEAFQHTHARADVAMPREDFKGMPLMLSSQYTAADLAALWLENPKAAIWNYYLWTSDTDYHGQRVFVGQNGKGLEVHRYLHMTERWRVPV